ncbi:MAG: hemerythrin domain-containing protein [Bdellovibrionales bacterium]|nr:hemerythrin domain-containing protein [Bdellovibrionales bacterium]
MDIYQALVKDHRKVQDLLNVLVNLDESDSDVRKELTDKIRDELIPHSRAEEAVFYNSIRAINTAQDLVWHGYEEHMQAEALLRTLQAAEKIDVGFKKTAEKLREALNHHIQEEEERIIPVARQLFTEDEARVMCEAFEEMKPEVREEGIVQTTLDMIANMMPPRLAAPLRTFTLKS